MRRIKFSILNISNVFRAIDYFSELWNVRLYVDEYYKKYSGTNESLRNKVMYNCTLLILDVYSFMSHQPYQLKLISLENSEFFFFSLLSISHLLMMWIRFFCLFMLQQSCECAQQYLKIWNSLNWSYFFLV